MYPRSQIALTICSALFVGIGSGVMSGPLCLFLAFIFWASVVFSVAQCRMSLRVYPMTECVLKPFLETEIVTLLPLDGAFIRLAGRMADPALGVTVGWNHFVSVLGHLSRPPADGYLQFAQTSYVIFEATVINTLVQYWGYNQSPAILLSSMLHAPGD